MKVIQFFAIASFLLLGSIHQVNAQFLEPTFTPGKDAVDFGEVDPSTDPGYRMFTFTNTGTEPLLITHIKPSCGCTTPSWPTEPIAPGKSAQIKVAYDIKRVGLINKSITITTNEEQGKDGDGNIIYKQHIIKVTGNVK